MCDVAVRRIDSGLPTVLIMGQQLTTTEDPWTQIRRILQLTPDTTLDEFLGALEAAAQAKQSKAVILIDALNEGTGRVIWKSHLASFLEAVSRYHWVSISISIRSTYERVIIPDDVIERLVRVEHVGFAEHEYRAARTFFDFYGIEQSSVPLLIPEFQNPLFLKILCKGLQDTGQTILPRGLQGITAIFDLFIESVNRKLADESYLDFNPRRHIVWAAVDQVAAIMAEKKQAYLSLAEVEDVVNQILPKHGFEKSLYHSLVSEGILFEDVLGSEGKFTDVVRFAYEKFSDHLIVKHLLDSLFNSQIPEQAFSGEGQLHFLIEKGSWLWAGLIEALCIQIPERIGKEYPEIATEIADDYRVQRGFFESIIWRATSSFSDTTKDFLNKYSSMNQSNNDESLNAILTVTTVPNHPYNADFLHRNLMKRKMPERDAWWSIFLHRHAGGEGAVDRLVDWAWSPVSRSYADDEAVRLYGITLAWFFTTSNRFLRDKATKALVNLLTNRLSILKQIIQNFMGVDDLYVLERLYAVAYGCVMRSTNLEEIGKFAQLVYEWIFEKSNPPIHILLRDYARGVIECAQVSGAKLDIDIEKIRPPYKSEWPDIPSEEEIEKYEHPGGSYDGPESEWWGQNRIVHSVMSDDFARYVIGINAGENHWLSVPLSEPQWEPKNYAIDDFAASLSPEERNAWDSYRTAFEKYEFEMSCVLHNLPDEILVRLIKANENDQEDTPQVQLNPDEEKTMTPEKQEHLKTLEQEITDLKDTFASALNDKKRELFETEIEPHLISPSQSSRPPRFEQSLVQRWIVKRVFEMGWTTKLFGEFDRYYIGYHGRDARKAERIGKKYQWIAYHEILARIADNFQYRGNFSNESPNDRYIGTWQLNVRDIDPSCVVREAGRGDGWTLHPPCWWFQQSFKSWDTLTDDVEWLKKADDLPDVAGLIQITNPQNKSNWLALNGFYRWQQPTPPELEHYDKITREVWYILRSYIVQKKDIEELFEWAKQQSFMGRWMPDPLEFYGIFLGEFYWSPAYKNVNDDAEDIYGWQGGEDESRIPKPIQVSSEEYVNEKGGFDCSIDETISIDVPTKMLVDGMNLSWNGVEGSFFDKEDRLIAVDPSVREKGPSILLVQRDAFLSFLEKNDYTVLWTVLGGKELIGGGIGGSVWKGRLEINGAYTFVGSNVVGEVRPQFIKPNAE